MLDAPFEYRDAGHLSKRTRVPRGTALLNCGHADHAGRTGSVDRVLDSSGLPDRPADEHRGRRRDAEPRDVPAGARTGTVAGGVRRAVGTPGRLALRRESQPHPDPYPTPG